MRFPVGSLSPALLALMLWSILAALPALGDEPGPDRVYARSWAEGPARWLLLSAEERQTRRLRTANEWATFIDEFWRRRDPEPTGADNSARDAFWHRVAEADALFSDLDRGSMSARGRVYLLLGPPSFVGQEYQTSPGWSPQVAGGEGPPAVHRVLVETWRWRPEDLTPQLRRELTRGHWRVELEVRFTLTAQDYQLSSGEDLLRLARRSFVLRDKDPFPGNGGP